MDLAKTNTFCPLLTRKVDLKELYGSSMISNQPLSNQD